MVDLCFKNGKDVFIYVYIINSCFTFWNIFSKQTKVANESLVKRICKALWTFFFLSGFSSQTLTIHRTAAEGREPSFIPLYHFHPLTNIETFICNFACEMTTRIFYRKKKLCLPDYYSMRFTTLSNYNLSDWLMVQCLFFLLDELILRFCYRVWHWKPIDLNSHRLSPLHYKRTD